VLDVILGFYKSTRMVLNYNGILLYPPGNKHMKNCANGTQLSMFVVSQTEYFIDGEEIVLIKTIDREDGDLFPDQSNTDIILQLQLTCESGTNMPLELWNKR
jgi:hypothetical protein